MRFAANCTTRIDERTDVEVCELRIQSGDSGVGSANVVQVPFLNCDAVS